MTDPIESEEWRVIPTYPLYEASSLGRIRRAVAGKGTRAGIVLKPYYHKKLKRFTVNMSDGKNNRKTQAVARLVALAFHGRPGDTALFVCHNNGNATDDRPENLRWDTPAGNNSDIKKHGTGFRKLTPQQVVEIRQSSVAMTKVATLYGVSHTHVWRIRRGDAWKEIG